MPEAGAIEGVGKLYTRLSFSALNSTVGLCGVDASCRLSCDNLSTALCCLFAQVIVRNIDAIKQLGAITRTSLGSLTRLTALRQG